jgi:hypothetical protein
VEPSALRPRAFSAVIASFALLLLAGPAHARREILVSLDYQTDPTLLACPAAVDFRKEIARQLGHDPFRESAPRRMVVRLYASGARMAGRVEWRDASDQWEGERTFSSRSESCAEMARAMALATAIQIQLLASAGEGSPAGPAAESKPPEPGIADDKPVVGAPAPAPVAVIDDGGPAVAPAAREPRIAVDVGVGVIQDFGAGPAFVVPRIAVSLGRPSAIGLRLAASGLGPGADVTRSEGVAQIDRLLMTLELIRLFRPGHIIQPTVAVGAGLQDVRVHGISAMPDLAQGHEGEVVSGVVAASAGLAFVLAARLSVVVEVEALFFRPSVTVEVGSSQAAYLDGAALFAHGGVLARF